MQPLTPEQLEQVRDIQRTVHAMLEERQALSPGGTANEPSRYWTDVCSFFDYMIDLAPRSFAKLRLHTHHLTGDHYHNYHYGNKRAFLDYWGPWLSIEGLPPGRVLTEPDDGIGFRLDDGRFVNQDIARFQRVVSTLSRFQVLDDLSRSAGPPRVLEIGGGYGGLALHLSRILGDCRYVLIDLPETLIFSAAYLSLHAPGKRIFLYDPAHREAPVAVSDHDFTLLPDYRLDALAGSEFDLALNVASMQEMRPDQITRYLDFLRDRCRGVFYSCNRDRQYFHEELPGLFHLIRQQFEMTEVPPPRATSSAGKDRVRHRLRESLRRGASVLGLVEGGGPAPDPYPFVEHLCRPRRSPPVPVPVPRA